MQRLAFLRYWKISLIGNGDVMRTDVRGTCRDFYIDEGWGWISVEDEGDVWVLFSAIQMKGFRALSPGQKVLFDLEKNPGLKEQSRRAANVRLMSTRL